MHYKDINYKKANAMAEIPEEELEFLSRCNEENDALVKIFYEKIKAIESYNFNNIYHIMDDFCSFKIRKSSLIKDKMKEMTDLMNKYNVLYMQDVYFQGYETGLYDEWILHKYLCPKFKKIIDENGIDKFHNLRQEFLNITKINDYLEKNYKSKN